MIPASPSTTLFSETSVPSFISKLWKLVDDGKYEQSIGWDESGLTFHIKEPYKFSLEILPQYFKHSNLNSFVRQLNMYGFRKVNSLERGSMKPPPEQGEPLEFQHPYFVRQRPDLLDMIKRRTSSTKINSQPSVQPKIEPHMPSTVGSIILSDSLPQNTVVIDGQQYMIQSMPVQNHQTQPFVEMVATPNPSTSYEVTSSRSQDLDEVLGELKRMRDRQVAMDQKLQHMEAENQTLWREVAHMRVKHMKQQEIVDKLFKFLLLFANQRTAGDSNNPGTKIPLGKRPMLAIGSPAVDKRRLVVTNNQPLTVATGTPASSSTAALKLPTFAAVPSTNSIIDDQTMAESIISRLERELKNDAVKNNFLTSSSQPSTNLKIADVTNEFAAQQAQTEKPISVVTSSVPQKCVAPKIERSQHPPIVYVSVDGRNKDTQKGVQNPNANLFNTYQDPSISNQALSANDAMPTNFDMDLQNVISPYSDVKTPSPTLAEHVDFVQSDLENVHDILSSNDFNFDINDLNDIFSNQDQNTSIFDSDQQLQPAIDIPAIDSPLNRSDIVGNEVQLYKAPALFTPQNLHNQNVDSNNDDFTSVLDEFIQCPPSVIDDQQTAMKNFATKTTATPLQTPLMSPVRPTMQGITVTSGNVAAKKNFTVPGTKVFIVRPKKD